MPSDRLDINKCRYEVFFQKVVEKDQHHHSHGLQSSNGKVFTLAPVLQLCEGRIPFSTTKPSPGYMELKDILTRLKVEDICLNKQDWRALGLLINESEYADAPDSSKYFNMQGMKINVELESTKCMVEFMKTFPP